MSFVQSNVNDTLHIAQNDPFFKKTCIFRVSFRECRSAASLPEGIAQPEKNQGEQKEFHSRGALRASVNGLYTMIRDWMGRSVR